MAHVVALYRYPVKGFTPESCEALTVLESGRVAGDRALAFRFADSGLPEDAWSRKYGFSVLANTPGVARLTTRFDPDTRRLRITLEKEVLADHAIDGEGRKALALAVEQYVMTLPENPFWTHPERRPLQLIGDGATPRYQDSQAGEITLHSRESLAQVAAALRQSDLEESRFRSNIAIDGVAAWAEQDWLGRTLRIGTVELDVVRPKTRCLATHANPRTGERDLAVMQVLVRAFAQQQPTFAIALTTRGRGGVIRLGDEITVLE
ncbi:MAG TPA: MOSC domain-containing protein [Burkholderiales bacterium]|nr:MOSC domain-containing protein [Burkholderiales bacterium]